MTNFDSLKTFGIHCFNRGKNFTYELIHKKKKVRSNRLGKDYEKETILHELDRRERTYNQQRTNELRRARASIRETAEEVRREQRTLTPEQPELDRLEETMNNTLKEEQTPQELSL